VIATILTQCSQVSSDKKVDQLVKSMGELAKFAGQQAGDTQKLTNATQDFAAGMKRQADNTAQLVGATGTAADAAKQSAQSQARMAKIASVSALPLLEMRDLRLSGFKAAPNAEGKYPIQISFSYVNVGTGRLEAEGMSISLDTNSELPKVPAFLPPNKILRAVPPGEGFGPATPWRFLLTKSQVEGLAAHKTFPFVTGYVDYSDSLGQAHRQCFAFQLQLGEDDATTGFYETGPAAYHCRT